MAQSANQGMEIPRSVEDYGFSGDPVQTSLVVTSAGDGYRRVREQEISRNSSRTSNQPGGPGQPDGGSATGADNYGGSPSISRPAPPRSSAGTPSRGRGRGRGAVRGGGSVGTFHNARAASMPPATHALSAGSFPSSSYIPVPSSPFAQQVQTMVQEGIRGNEAQVNINSKRRWEAADAALLRSLLSYSPYGFLLVHQETNIFCAVEIRSVDAYQELAVVKYANNDSDVDGMVQEVPLAHLYAYSRSFHGQDAMSISQQYWPAAVSSQLMPVHLFAVEACLRGSRDQGAVAVTPVRRVEFSAADNASDRAGSASPAPPAPPSDVSDSVLSSASTPSPARRRKRPPKLDMKAVPQYTGENKIGDPADVTLRPTKWLCALIRSLRGQGVEDEDFVQCALLYMKPALAEAYEQNVMRPVDAPRDWTPWNSAFPPDPRSLEIETFATWLRSYCINPVLLDEVRNKIEAIRQGPTEAVMDYNRRFNELHSILHEAGEHDDTSCGTNWASPQDNKWIRKHYVGGLLQPLRDAVLQLETAAHAPKFLTDVHADNYQSDMADPLQRREFNRPYHSMQALNAQSFSIPLHTLQQMALHAQHMRHQTTYLQEQRQSRQSDSRDGMFGRHYTRGSRNVPTGQSRRSDSPAPFRRDAPMRLNALRADAQDSTAPAPHDCDSLALYARLAQEGRVRWSKAQLNKLRAENRCFRCGQQGHTQKECQSPPADPVTVRFNSMVLEDDEELEDDDDMYQRLLDLDTREDESGNGSYSRV